MLASTSREFTVKLWDLESRQTFGDLQGHTGNLTNIAFSPDGKLLATASEDITVRLWDVDSHSWVSRACARANRNLSVEEWHHCIGKDVPYRRTYPNLIPAE